MPAAPVANPPIYVQQTDFQVTLSSSLESVFARAIADSTNRTNVLADRIAEQNALIAQANSIGAKSFVCVLVVI